jgi:hypothetical protein
MAVDFEVKKIYDPLYGRVVKEIKATDIVSFGTTGTQGAVGSTLANCAISAYFDYYVTNIWAVTTATIQLDLQNGTSTLISFFGQFGSGNQLSINTNRDTPILKISGAATLNITSSAGGSACVWISGVREPKFAYIETA